jgi:hypothetical protein
MKQDEQKEIQIKKRYSRPQVEVYGDLSEVTGAVGKLTGKADGTSPNPNHVRTA